MTVATDTIGVRLLADCTDAGCQVFATPLHEQLGSGAYDRCSTLVIPDSIHEWTAAHRTARKRSARARRLGYVGMRLSDRGAYTNDIYAINTSAPERQGRPMSAGYLERPSAAPDVPPACPLHGVHPYGVFDPDAKLCAYLWLYRSGDLALVSSILGHADHLDAGIVYALFHAALEGEIGIGPGAVVYNRHDSGSGEGLRWMKERLGFAGRDMEWLL